MPKLPTFDPEFPSQLHPAFYHDFEADEDFDLEDD